MNKSKSIIASALILGATTLLANNGAQNRCIIEFNDGVSTNKISEIAKDLAQKGNSTVAHTYKNVMKGATLNMPCFAAEAAFGRDGNIKSFHEDIEVSAVKGKPVKEDPVVEDPVVEDPVVETLPPQEISWGTSTVGSFDGSNKTAWIVDTGIDLDHKDLNVDQSRGRNFVNTRKTADDDAGHGTHVAGIIGAIDNYVDSENPGIGTKGVAQGATVVPVKVLNSRGTGSTSDILAGLDYVAKNAKARDCVNLSLAAEGVSTTYTVLDDAVINAAKESGAYFVLAAGNSAKDISNTSPARVNGTNIFTVSATDSNGNFATKFSNYGSSVDYAAPGVDIISTYNDGKTTIKSGTSMAAPHVCGALMSGNITSIQTAYNDPDGTADPIIKINQ